MNFGSPQWFWALLLVPVGVLLFVQAERRSAQRLRDFVSPRLLPALAGKVDRRRRRVRFALQMAGLALAIVSLTQPRWGYTFEEAHRKGIDLLIAVDTSRSMLSNDVSPNRLERVKLAAQDLINQLQGDRVGLIAFAGRAFIQAPLTIDYGAVVEAINDLNTQTIPEGGTNISEAITLADKTYGKSATGNRALIIFTDGEELSGDAVKTAQALAETGARIFTVGVGTTQGSLIPIQSDESQSAFVKDAKGQVVKSKLDEHRLEEIARAAHGFYLHLENGPRTMQQLATEGIGKIQAGDIDVRLSRRAIERYEWPLGLGVLCLASSILIGDRKRVRRRGTARSPIPAATAAAVGIILFASPLPRGYAAAPGIDDYHGGNFTDAYAKFQDTLKAHPQTGAADKLNFDSGAAAYKMKEYGKALESFSQALLSPDQTLQSKSHYNLGNTLYERGENEKTDDKKLANWTNALQHYEETLKIEPQNKEAKENYEFVKNKIEELKNKKPPPSPTPTPTPKQNKDQQKKSDQKNQQQQQQQQDQQKQQDQQQQQSSGGQGDQQQQQQQQSQGNSGKDQEKKDQNNQSQSGDQKQNEQKDQPEKDNGTPSPTPSGQGPGATPSPSPGEGKDKKKNDAGDQQASPTPGNSGGSTPTPSPQGSPTPGAGEGSNGNASPSPGPSVSPNKKFSGEIKGNAGDNQEKPPADDQQREAEVEKEGEMSERQAQALLESMRDEEARVQLDERRAARRVYNDW